MLRASLAAAAAAALTVAACGPRVTISPLNPSPRPLVARPPETVQIFASHVPEGVIDVYLIEVAGGPGSDRMPRLREEAARLGCDGLLLNGGAPDTQSNATMWTPRGPSSGSTTNEGYVSAVCVVLPVGPAGPPGAP